MTYKCKLPGDCDYPCACPEAKATEVLTIEQQIYDALTVAVEAVCEARCPSKWKTSEPQPHSDECRKVKAARSAWMDHCSTMDLIASGGLPLDEGLSVSRPHGGAHD